MEISIVTTLYQSAPYIEEFHRRMTQAVSSISDDYEIILVNDGSPDGSLAAAVAIHERDPHVRVVDLSRNFGHHKAIMTGLSYARGERVFLVDCDLEEDPALIRRFAEEMDASRADVVYGVQNRRSGTPSRVWSGKLFYAVFNLVSPTPIPKNLLTVRLMTRAYVRATLEYQEREFIIAGIWAAAGFSQVPVGVDKSDKGTSSYNVFKRFAYAVDLIASFSNLPLYGVFYLGLVIFVMSFVAASYLIVRRLFFDTMMSGWPSLMVSIWLLGGITLMCLGVIGVYLSKVFTEVKQRPFTLVRKVYGDPSRPGAPA